MNCFEWQSLSSDYLDGTLEQPIKQVADQHVNGCKNCNERHRRFRLILSSLASQPRTSLPVPIRKSPLVAPIHKPSVKNLSTSKWLEIPWYFRTAIECGLVAVFILVGISAGPKVRKLYERSIEKKVDDLSDSLTPELLESIQNPAEMAPQIPTIPRIGDSDSKSPDSEDFATSGDEDSDGEDVSIDQDETIYVGKSEVWRFNLKSDSPFDLRPQIIKALTELGVPTSHPGVNGIEAPGGIQFDLILPQSVVANLKHHLQKMAPAAPINAQASSKEPFTWYKKKSRTPIPEGKARVVIWISQI